MRKLLSVLLVALLMAGCGEENLDDPETFDEVLEEAVAADKLQRRGGRQ